MRIAPVGHVLEEHRDVARALAVEREEDAPAPGVRRDAALEELATALSAWRPKDHRLVLFGLLLCAAGTGWVLTTRWSSMWAACRRKKASTT